MPYKFIDKLKYTFLIANDNEFDICHKLLSIQFIS